MPSGEELAERHDALASFGDYDYLEYLQIGKMLEIVPMMIVLGVAMEGMRYLLHPNLIIEEQRSELYLALAQGDWENIIESEGVE
jgi:hypothetical protein